MCPAGPERTIETDRYRRHLADRPKIEREPRPMNAANRTQEHRIPRRRTTLGGPESLTCAPAPRRTPRPWTGTLGGPAAAVPTDLGRDGLQEYKRLDQMARIYDSRPGLAPTGVAKGRLLSRQRRTITALLGGAVPAAAVKMVHIEVTVANTNGSGSLFLAKAGERPLTPCAAWSSPGSTTSVRAVVDVDALGRFAIEASGQADVIVDVLGFYV